MIASFVFYSILTSAVHKTTDVLFPEQFNCLAIQQQLQLDFRGMRIVAGIQGIICFLYALFADHHLGITGVNETTSSIFEIYIGYIIFELFLMALWSEKLSDLATKPGLRILVLHHVLVGFASFGLCRKSMAPHYLGLLSLGNEAAVISRAIIDIAKKLGFKDHFIVKFNTLFLPIQYILRQFLFFYIAYFMFTYYDVVVLTCADWLTFVTFYIGMNILGLVINPIWTFRNFRSAFRFWKSEKSQKSKREA